MQQQQHACRPCMHFELKLETTSSQKTSCRTLVCPTACFLATGGLVKFFHKIPWFFYDYSVFFKFHDFSMHGTYFSVFPGFPWFPELVGTLSLPLHCLWIIRCCGISSCVHHTASFNILQIHTGKCICRFAGIYAYCWYFIDRKW